MRRVFCPDIPEAGEVAVLEPREQEHLFKVLRARPGEKFGLLDGKGGCAAGVVENGRILRVISREVVPVPQEKFHLCCAMPKKQKLDQLLKQAAELGVWSIRPVRCVHSVAGGESRERWDLLLREACKQSGNPFLPRIEPEAKLPAVLEKLEQENIKIYYGSVKLTEPGGRIAGDKAVVIGPEGGFAPEEIEMLEKKSAEPLNLGPYVLRLETAAVCALAVLRKLSVVLVMLLTVFAFTGCGDDYQDLIEEGDSLRDSGNANGAVEKYREAIAENPENPQAYLELAKVCEEQLNENIEALYNYDLCLKKLPEGDAELKNQVESAKKNLQSKLAEAWGGVSESVSTGDAELQQQLSDAQQDNADLLQQLKKQQKDNNNLKQQIKSVRRR